MPTLIVEKSDFAGYLPDDTVVGAEVVSIKLEEKPYFEDDGVTPVRRLVFRFVIREPGHTHDGTPIRGETPNRFTLHPNNKLKNWAEAIEGVQYPEGYSFDTDVLQGKPCRIVIGHKTYEKDGETKESNFVKDVMPARQPTGASGF